MSEPHPSKPRIPRSNRGRRAESVSDRFWRKVDRSGGAGACWPWLARCDQDGYGWFALEPHRPIRAHRYARVLAGDDVAGMVVRHRCDNPPCVNPDHLITGTVADNVADRQAKERGQRGERNHSAVLTAAQVAEIRAKALGMGRGYTVKLGAEYGVHQRTISHVVRGTNWRHVPMAPAHVEARS